MLFAIWEKFLGKSQFWNATSTCRVWQNKMKKRSFLGAKNDHFWSFFPISTRRKAEFYV